jgi:hypothetical protein
MARRAPGSQRSVPAGVPVPAAEQREELGGVRGRDAVGVGIGQQGRVGEPPDLLGPVIRLAQQQAGLVHQSGEGVAVGSDLAPRLVHRGLPHLAEPRAAQLVEPGEDLGKPAVAAAGRGNQGQPADPAGMLDGAAQAGAAAEGVPEQVSLPQAEVLDHCGDVVAEPLEAEGTAGVPGVAVGLQLDRDDLALPGQLAEQLTEHAGQAETTVNHHQRDAAIAAAFPVNIHAVNRRVAGRSRAWRQALLARDTSAVDTGRRWLIRHRPTQPEPMKNVKPTQVRRA